MYSKFFDPHKSLLALGIFRISILIPFLVAGISITLIIYNSRLDWDLGYGGFNHAVDIFKVPLGIIALIIPIVALLAANHRSEQSKEQMRLSSSQNVFANHYKHLEEFEKYCERLYDRQRVNADCTAEMLKKSSSSFSKASSHDYIGTYVIPGFRRMLYRKIYPDSREGNLNISKLYLASLDDFITKIVGHCDGFATTDREEWQQAIYKISKDTTSFALQNHLMLTNRAWDEKMIINDEAIIVPAGDISILIQQLDEIIFTLVDVLGFDVSYVQSDLVRHVLEWDGNKMPKCEIAKFPDIEPFNVRALLNIGSLARP